MPRAACLDPGCTDAIPCMQDSDGSWEDVSEEEKEAEEAVIKLKGKMPMEGPVLEEIQRQEAERLAQQLRAEDSD